MATLPPPSARHRSPRALLALTRLWVSGATGVVRGASAPAGVPFCRGGIVSSQDLPTLQRIAREDWIQFDHYSVVGDTDRAAVARVITRTALAHVPRPPPPGVARILPLAPRHRLEELGLVAVRNDGEKLVVPSSPLVAAIELLRLIRVESWGAAPMLPAGVSLKDAAEPDIAVPDPLRALCGEDDLLWTAEQFNIEDLADLSAETAQWPTSNPVELLREARVLLEQDRAAEAEAMLVGLRDSRVDQPEVLYLLIEAIVRQRSNPTPSEISDLKRWFKMAELLGGAGAARARAERVLRAVVALP